MTPREDMIRGELRRIGFAYYDLEREIPKLSDVAQADLLRALQDLRRKVDRERQTAQREKRKRRMGIWS